MPNSGNLFPGTAETLGRGAGANWDTPLNVLSDNATDTSCTATTSAGSDYLVCRNFGLAFAAGDTISGITIRIEASEHTSGNEILNAQLQNDAGALIGTPKTVTLSGTGKIVYTYGGIADTWGATLTPAIVNSPNFGVRFWYTTQHVINVDFVTAAFEYVLAPVVPGGPFPGPIFPGPIFPGPIFPGPGPGGEFGDSTTSVEISNAAVEMVFPAAHKTLAGVALSADVGFVTTQENKVAVLSGVDATVDSGTIVVGDRSRALTGTTATAAVGSVIKADGVQLTGVVASIGTASAGSGVGSSWGTSWGNSWGTSWGAGTGGGGIGSAWGTSWGTSWGDSWGTGSLAFDDIGIGDVFPSNEVAVSGNEVNATVEETSELLIRVLSGVSVQVEAGYVSADPAKLGNLSGVAVLVEIGNLQAPLVGNEVTCSVGTVVATVAFGLTSVEAEATNGSLTGGLATRLTGVDVQVFLESLQTSRTIGLSGVTVTVAVGSLEIPTQLGALTGVGLDADVETLIPETSVVLSGVDVTADVGHIDTSGPRDAALTGVEVSVDVGFITAQNDVLAILTGVDIDAAVGTVIALGIKTLDGVALSATVGTIVPIPHRTAALSGVAVTVDAGAVRRETIPLAGVSAGAAAGSVGQPLLIKTLNSVQVSVTVGHIPKEGDIILDTVGVDVGAGEVGVLGVIPAVPVGTYRHSGATPIRKRAVKDLETLEREMALMEE